MSGLELEELNDMEDLTANPRPGAGYNSKVFESKQAKVPYLEPVRIRSSVLLPFVVGLVLSLLLSTGIVVVLSRFDGSVQVPEGITNQQIEVAIATSEGVRRSLNAAIDDLVQLGVVHTLAPSPEATFDEAAREFMTVHERYRDVTLTENTNIEATRIDPEVVRDPEGDSLIMWAPMRSNTATSTIVGYYKVEFLRNALSALGSADGWLVDPSGTVVASTVDGSGGTLPNIDLIRAFETANSSGAGAFVTAGSSEYAEIISFARVEGEGPGGQLDFVLVTSRAVAELQLATVDLQLYTWLIAVAVVIVMLATLAWFYGKIVSPLRSLRRDLHTISNGELRLPVAIARDDEIGLSARALEEIRVGLKRLVRQQRALREQMRRQG
jgi:HAMP domain-containing protein